MCSSFDDNISKLTITISFHEDMSNFMKIYSFDLKMMRFFIVSQESFQNSLLLNEASPSGDNILFKINNFGNCSIFKLSSIDPFSLKD